MKKYFVFKLFLLIIVEFFKFWIWLCCKKWVKNLILNDFGFFKKDLFVSYINNVNYSVVFVINYVEKWEKIWWVL